MIGRDDNIARDAAHSIIGLEYALEQVMEAAIGNREAIASALWNDYETLAMHSAACSILGHRGCVALTLTEVEQAQQAALDADGMYIKAWCANVAALIRTRSRRCAS